jgi:hypothetical protein
MELEAADTGIFDGGRYFDVRVTYAKADTDDVLVKITVTNRGPEKATVHLLPQLWFRNTWSWGCKHEGCTRKPSLAQRGASGIEGEHPGLGSFRFDVSPASDGTTPRMLFTENETNAESLYDSPNPSPYVKDAFHRLVVSGEESAVNPEQQGTKVAAWYVLDVPAHGEVTVSCRLSSTAQAPARPFGPAFEKVFESRKKEADAFYAARISEAATPEERNVARQAYAGLIWSKQFYHYIVKDWLEGDANQPPPPESRKYGRNADWGHVYMRDILSMPDKWEYPWFAAWDLAFHMIPFAKIDPQFAKEQLVLLLREWYMHPNGQIPAYEFAFGDVNPPVHAWAAWRVYKRSAKRGERDRVFLSRVFQKLLINFTWWVNRKDAEGKHLFSGGFLGLDNIGVFDRSQPLPTGGHLEQADGTAWMAFYAATMLSMSLELSKDNAATEDVASKFFEHFIAIADAMNTLGGHGLWDEEDGFYYDQLHVNGRTIPLKIRSLVGVIPLFATEILDDERISRLPGFKKRLDWFLENRPDLARQISCAEVGGDRRRLLSIANKDRLVRVLRYVLDENEFLSPYGVRSVSRVHKDHPYEFRVNGDVYRVPYEPAESSSGLFGGNSNWRGPIWFPLNHLLIEALERYHHYYGDDLKVECPTGSGNFMDLGEVAQELSKRLARIFLTNEQGSRPCHGGDGLYTDPNFKDLVLFYEYFHGDTGRGVGASHQTGWTALAASAVEEMARAREASSQTVET